MNGFIVKLTALAVALVVLVYVIGTTIRNNTGTKQLTASTPVVKAMPTDVKVLPVVVAKKAFVESRLRVVLPPGHSVTSTADLKPSETGYEALSVIDENTGVSTIQQYEKPRSALAFPMTGRIKAGYGTGTEGNSVKIGAELTPLRVGALYLTGEVELRRTDVKTNVYTGVLVEYRF